MQSCCGRASDRFVGFRQAGSCVLLVVGMGWGAPGAAQTVVRVADEVTCTSCTIRLDPVVTLQARSDRVLFANLPPPSVARDSEGRYLVTTESGEGAIAVFDGSGTLERVFGRFGEGPAEFSNSRMYIRVGWLDTVVVFQRIRRTILSPGAETLVRGHALEVLARDPVLFDDLAIVMATVRSPRGGSSPVQVLDQRGRVLRGIGSLVRPDEGLFSAARRIARAAGDRGVWLAPWTRYEMSRFDLFGEERLRVIREADWFPPYVQAVRGEGYTSPQRPRIEGIRESTEGRVLAVVSRGDPDFDPEFTRETREVTIDPYDDDSGRLDTRLEIVDVQNGRVLARRDCDQRLRLVSTPGDRPLLFSLRAVPSGELVIDIWEVRLER